MKVTCYIKGRWFGQAMGSQWQLGIRTSNSADCMKAQGLVYHTDSGLQHSHSDYLGTKVRGNRSAMNGVLGKMRLWSVGLILVRVSSSSIMYSYHGDLQYCNASIMHDYFFPFA